MLIILILIITGIIASVKINIKIYLLVAIMLALVVAIKEKYKKYIPYIIVSVFFAIYSYITIYKFDFKYVDNQKIEGEFLIVSLESEEKYYDKYICKNNSGDKFILKIPTNKEKKLETNNKIYLEGSYSLPSLSKNEGCFNYRRYLNSQKIYGTIIVKQNSYSLINKGKLNAISKIKKNIKENFEKLLPKDYAGVINGMINGDTKNISENILDDFRNSGISHLLSVSGSNIAYIITFVSIFLSKLLGKYISYYIIVIIIIIFILVSGANASVVRAGIMAILNIIAILLSRKSDTKNNIYLSAIILLTINPLIIYDVGFILSFVGTLGIVLLSEKIKNNIEKIIKIKFIAETISITLSAQIMLLPIMAYYFNTVSLISVISNFIIVPISEFLTILGFITIIISNLNISIGKIISYAIYTLIYLMLKIARVVSKFSWANILVATPKIWMIFFYYLAIYIFFSNNSKEITIKISNYKRIRKIKTLILELMTLFIIINKLILLIPKNYISLNMIDVGQGDSFYIETQNRKTILIDGGGSENSDYDVGENILIPYLLNKGKTKIDLIIISHPHEDHIEGIFTALEKLKVKQVVISENIDKSELIIKLKKLCNEKNIEIIKVAANDTFKIDGLNFDVIYPKKETNDKNINNMSIVLKLKFGEITSLFTGDLEEKAEEEIKQNIKVDILKVGHHGSKTSTSEEFLEKTKPKIALISVGKNNSYGHPNKEVIERLEKINAKILRTDEKGEVKLKIKKNKIIIQK